MFRNRNKPMSNIYLDTTATSPALPSRTRILFDLADVLTASEITQFEAAAHDAGAASLTEHLLNLTLRLPHQGEAA